MNFTFGSDPEFILVDSKGAPKSAINIIGAGKEKRISFEKNTFFYDNVLAECTVEPAKSKNQAIDNIGKAIAIYAGLVSPYKITTIQAAEFHDEELLHPDARKSGCEVEFCAYKLKNISSKKIKKIFKESNLRTAGGHVHLGTELGRSHETCIMLVRMLDLFLGLAGLIIDGSAQSAERRKIYGQAGRYRQPKYGVEYRTLGNFWIASPKLVELVYEICESVLELTEKKIYENFWKVDYEKLNSDSFWNEQGDPASCHQCDAYNVDLLRELFILENNEIKNVGSDIIEFALGYLPDDIVERIHKFSGQKFNIYEEWAI